MLVNKYKELYKILCEGEEKVMIHCAAGIHRTGITAFILNRMDGLDSKVAYETLKLMREDTYKGVGEWRIELAEKLFQDKIMIKVIDDEKTLKAEDTKE